MISFVFIERILTVYISNVEPTTTDHMEPSHTTDDIINRMMEENTRFAVQIEILDGINNSRSVQIIDLRLIQRNNTSGNLHEAYNALQSLIRMQSLTIAYTQPVEVHEEAITNEVEDNGTGEPITDEVFDCCVCLESACDTKVCFDPCNHGVCITCYASMAQHRLFTCPLCRTCISAITTHTVIY